MPGQRSKLQNPFRNAKVGPGRVDQGADYTGRPGDPIYAIGKGKIVDVSTESGWPGGGLVVEQLSDGPYAGQYVYTAEDISPNVQVGQDVDTNTTIAHFRSGQYGIETGWGAGPPNLGQTMAWVHGEANYTPGGDPGAWPTGYGENFNRLMASLGAPNDTLSGKVHGKVGALGSGCASLLGTSSVFLVVIGLVIGHFA